MTAKKRRRHAPEFKAQVGSGDKTISQLASKHEIVTAQISQWQRRLLQRIPEVFGRTKPDIEPETLTAPLYQEIGRLKMGPDWLKKSQAMFINDKRTCIGSSHPQLSIQRQCELIGLHRSNWHYQVMPAQEGQENLLLMRLIDEQYTRTPFFGSRKVTAWLNVHGYPVNRKRIQRLIRLMKIQGVTQAWQQSEE